MNSVILAVILCASYQGNDPKIEWFIDSQLPIEAECIEISCNIVKQVRLVATYQHEISPGILYTTSAIYECEQPSLIFSDGFESGSAEWWDKTIPALKRKRGRNNSK